jgi:hypothetical protein
MLLRSRIVTCRALISGVCAACLAASPSIFGATFTVSNTSDSGNGSLRQALTQLDLSTDSTNLINFSILLPPFSIAPASPLPTITQPVTIDATTQLGFLGTPVVELNGTGAGTASGLVIATTNCTIRGLAINRFSLDGITIQQGTGNLIANNFLGTDITGTSALGNAQGGVTIQSSGNTVGGTSSVDRNLISANVLGIWLEGSAAKNNVVLGNYIGTDVTGMLSISNTTHGIELFGCVSNVIGGTVTGAGNVISGNGGSGIYLYPNGSAGANGNLIQGNYVGVNAGGTGALPNNSDGITILNSASNTIGGTNAGAGDVLSGNGNCGLTINVSSSSNNVVQGCLIGTTASGLAGLPNHVDGVEILGANGNLIGGTNSLARNVISGNVLAGVDIESSPAAASGNMVWGNYIGVDVTGANALGNEQNGVFILAATNNSIGGSVPGAGNVISGNGQYGVYITDNTVTGATALGNVIAGNLIGTDATGLEAVGNSLSGILLAAPGCLIGGANVSARNVISGNGNNTGYGAIYLYTAAASNNVVQGCYIGVDVTGTNVLTNLTHGILIYGASGNLIGGPGAGAGNLISGNWLRGISLMTNANGNTIQGNYIGPDATGTRALANGFSPTVQNEDGAGGIDISGCSSNLIGGMAPGAGNLISGNYDDGIAIGSPYCFGNVIQGNLIGTQADGMSPLGNQWAGVEMLTAGYAASTIIGGTNPAAFNVIWYANYGVTSTAGRSGVRIRTGTTGTIGNTNNQVLGNSIYKSGNLGIDSGAIGVTINNPNGLGQDQNYPFLTNTLSANGVTLIQGLLTNTPNSTCLIQFYASATPNASAPYGEGQMYLGSTNVTTGGNGIATINAVLPVGVAAGQIISSTAFNLNQLKNTSEFSLDLTSQAAQAPGIVSLQPASTNVPYGSNATFSVTASGTGPLSYQWFFNNTNLVGGNASTLVVANVQPANAGSYSVQVSSIFGATNSASAALTVQINPVSLQAGLANGLFTISWPTNGPTLVLQQTPSLTAPVVWLDVTNPPVVSGGQLVVTNSPDQMSQFYRLIFEP